jgi:subtilisin family serine protease
MAVKPPPPELRALSPFGLSELGRTNEPIFVEIRAAERRTADFSLRLSSLDSFLISRGVRADRVWSGVKHLYVRIDVSGIPYAARDGLVSELKAQPLVAKVFSSATANHELKDLAQLESSPSIASASASEAKLRGFREKRRNFRPDLTGKNTGEIIVKYVETETVTPDKMVAAKARMGSLHAAVGAHVVQALDLSTGTAEVVALPANADMRAVLERYLNDEGVEYAEPNHVYTISAEPSDPYYEYGYLWGMESISAPAAWDVRTSASSVVVAVVDTGIDYDHPDLAANMWSSGGYHGYDAVNNDYDPMDDDIRYHWIEEPGPPPVSIRVPYEWPTHGTHVAGTIGAVGNNGIGVTGVAWGASLMAVKIFHAEGSTNTTWIVAGLNYARTHGAHIVNASWAGGAYDQSIDDAIDALRDAGVVFVNSAGNYGYDNDINPYYPSCYGFPSMIVVGASNASDQRPSWSHIGRWSVDVFASGTSIFSTQGMSGEGYQGTGYRYESGTSMAAPHVTGIIALAKAQFPWESANELVDRVRFSADSVSGLENYCQSGGRANAAAALGTRPSLIKLSSRCQVNTGDQIAISGIVITGPDSKRVAFRALGPTLGLSGQLANPQIAVYSSASQLIASNDDWGTLSQADRNELTSFGIAPSNSLESAWIGTLAPGAYTVHLSGAGGTTGIGQIESWDIDSSTINRLFNVSTRCFVGTGNSATSAGLVITGDKPRQVYIRALGPTLTDYGVSGALQDTVIALKDSDGTTIASNDDWRTFDGNSTALETRLTNTGYPPGYNPESVIVKRLQPGNYTVILEGKNGTTGVGLIEVNEY